MCHVILASLFCCVCFRVFVFFFFKQKTAYELRISDWSSDVCSSDLVGVDDGHFAIKVTRNVGGKLVSSSIRSQAWVGRQTTASFGKIGRASCRERVCQYV